MIFVGAWVWTAFRVHRVASEAAFHPVGRHDMSLGVDSKMVPVFRPFPFRSDQMGASDEGAASEVAVGVCPGLRRVA